MRPALKTSWPGIKPPPGMPVNQAHPLAQGLLGFWLLPDAGAVLMGALDDQLSGLSAGTVTPSPTPYGVGQTFSTDNVAYQLGTGALLKPGFPFTFFAIVKLGSFSSNYGLIATATSASPIIGASLLVNNSSGAKPSILVGDGSGGSTIIRSTSALTTGLTYCLAGTARSTSSGMIYINGLPDGANIAGTTALANNTSQSNIGGGNGFTSTPSNHVTVCAAMWNRALSDAEHLQLALDPFGVFGGRPMIGGAGLAAIAHSISLGGTIASAGIARRAGAKHLAGAEGPSGIVRRAAARKFAGTETPSGVVVRQAVKVERGTITPIGAPARAASKHTTGTVAPAGAAQRATSKTHTGTVASAGQMKRASAKQLAGALATAGRLGKATSRFAGGAVAAAGALRNRSSKRLAAAIAPAGAMRRDSSKHLAAAIAPTGSLRKAIGQFLRGLIPSVGHLATARPDTPDVLGEVSLASSIVGGVELTSAAVADLQLASVVVAAVQLREAD